jgi:GNAT superfamily N-acetyltransferase
MAHPVIIRPALPADAKAMSAIHVQSWRETYRGTLMSDAVLDDPELLPARERFWAAALMDRRWASNRVAVAEWNGSLIGIAMSGPVTGEAWSQHLYVLYVLEEHHGRGVGAGLLKAVIRPDERAALWVGDPNPRAQAFYCRSGFIPDGTVKVEDGVREIRMVRLAIDREPSAAGREEDAGRP